MGNELNLASQQVSRNGDAGTICTGTTSLRDVLKEMVDKRSTEARNSNGAREVCKIYAGANIGENKRSAGNLTVSSYIIKYHKIRIFIL